jgi:hypothetical protein
VLDSDADGDADGDADLDADADAGRDGDGDVDADAVADEGEAGADGASEDGGDAAPACGPDLIPGERVCARGRAANFIDILPLPGDSADPPLQVQIKDLISSLGDPTANLAEAVVGADGAFLAPSFDLAETPARTLVLLVGEDEAAAPEGPGMVWQRSFGGMVRTDTTTTVYELPTVYAVPRASVTAWNALLGTTLETTGFVLLRIVELGSGGVVVPLAGASLTFLGGGTPTIRYFADGALTSFKAPGDPTTGGSGVVLLVPGAGAVMTDMCGATLAGYTAAGNVSCAASPYRASIGHLSMVSE